MEYLETDFPGIYPGLIRGNNSNIPLDDSGHINKIDVFIL